MSNKELYSHYLLEVKREYSKTLSNLLVPVIYEGILHIYQLASKIKPESRLKMFQLALKKIPEWNQSTVIDEYNRIINKTNCDWMSELITAVFISHAKILSSLKTKKKSKTLNLKIPNCDYFIHKVYIQCARNFWKNPYLFDDKVDTIKYQKNMNEIERIIEQSILDTIRDLLPTKTILQQYISLDNNSSSESSDSSSEEEVEPEEEKKTKKNSKKDTSTAEDITTDLTEKQKNSIKKIVKQEMSTVSKLEEDKTDNFSVYSVDNTIRKNIAKNSSIKSTTKSVEEPVVKIDNDEQSFIYENNSENMSLKSYNEKPREPSKDIKPTELLVEKIDTQNINDLLVVKKQNLYEELDKKNSLEFKFNDGSSVSEQKLNFYKDNEIITTIDNYPKLIDDKSSESTFKLNINEKELAEEVSDIKNISINLDKKVVRDDVSVASYETLSTRPLNKKGNNQFKL
jgi:hypothetical protein